MSLVDDRAALGAAVAAGLDFLARAQRPTGEWETLTGVAHDLADGEPYATSPYLTALVLHCLYGLPRSPMVERALDFLASQREPVGIWNYEGLGARKLPFDFDTTSCATGALALYGREVKLSFFGFLWRNEAAVGGPYYTWMGINDGDHRMARQVDALVNANIAWCLAKLGQEAPGIEAFLRTVIETGAYVGAQSWYAVSPFFPVYALSRAIVDGPLPRMVDVLPELAAVVAGAAPASAFDTLCRCCVALNADLGDATDREALAAILALQGADGGWPAGAAWLGYSPKVDGGQALSTGLALEGIAKFASRYQLEL